MTDLRLSREGAVARIALARPERLNAIRAATKDELLGAVRSLRSDPEVRVIVLTGEGRAFCAGADLAELAPAGDEPIEVLRRLEATQEIVAALRGATAVTIAAVNGVVAGGGLGLALACDLVFAAASADVVLAFAERGLVPDAAMARTLSEAVGTRAARYLLLTKSRLGAAEALQRGLYDEVVDDAELEGRVQQVAAEIVAHSPFAVAATKRLYAAGDSLALFAEAAAQTVAITTRGADR